jgi:SpoVK/Ycf46/Vps4 family AAA+-type ATPase
MHSDGANHLLTTMLTCMDGLSSQSSGVFVLGATNKPAALDPAIVRRLQRRVYIPLPTLPDRAALMALYLYPFPLHPQCDLVAMAERTMGYSGSDLTEMLKIAVSLPLKRKMAELAARHPGGSAAAAAARLAAFRQAEELVKATPITNEDLMEALGQCHTLPTVTEEVLRELENYTAPK